MGRTVTPATPALGRRRRTSGPTQDAAQQDTYEALLSVAARLFRRKGYEGTSIREIARELGVEGGSLYYYIDSKSDLLFEISVRALAEVRVQLEAIVNSDAAPLDKIRGVMIAHATHVLAKVDSHAAMLFEMRSLPDSNRAEIVERRDVNESLMAETIRVAREAGLIRTDQSLRFQKLAMLSLLNWPLIWYREDGEMSPAEIGEQLAETFLGGIEI